MRKLDTLLSLLMNDRIEPIAEREEEGDNRQKYDRMERDGVQSDT